MKNDFARGAAPFSVCEEIFGGEAEKSVLALSLPSLTAIRWSDPSSEMKEGMMKKALISTVAGIAMLGASASMNAASAADYNVNPFGVLLGAAAGGFVGSNIGNGNGRLVATGGLTLKQSDFGIKPFSILNGGLRVRDGLDVSFHLVLAPAGR